jgi:hypothetical protein
MAGLPLITLPDFETLVVSRLQICYGLITGVNKSFMLPPANEQHPDSIPFAYTLVGAMTENVPMELVGGGQITIPRTYVARLVGGPAAGSIDNAASDGAQALVDLLPFFARFRSYFIGHPKLQTDTLDALQYMRGQLAMNDGGFVTRPAPGGIDHLCIEWSLTITMSAQVSTLA